MRQLNQMNDLRELMKLVDARYDQDARQLINRNKEQEREIQSLEKALKAAQNHGSHMDKMASFFQKGQHSNDETK